MFKVSLKVYVVLYQKLKTNLLYEVFLAKFHDLF